MENKINNLEYSILEHKALYYRGCPKISDSAYDKLEESLKKLRPDSFVLSVIGDYFSTDKVKHTKKMLSLDKVYDIKKLSTWFKDNEVIGMYKIDGSSCSLTYQSGAFSAKTRGNGVFGKNITDKILWINEIPKDIKENLEITGEIYITEENFIALSEEMKNRKLDIPSSQRNIVAGLLDRKENPDLCKYLSFMAFGIDSEDSKEINKFKAIEKLGFKTPSPTLIKKEDLEKFIADSKEFINNCNFLIDGLVFTYNDIEVQNDLGETSHHPRYKMAFKYKSETAITKIIDIQWQVSKAGILTPVAHIESTTLSDANITKVTLHNYGMVKQNNLKSGDEIEIIRSGEVIPKFERLVSSSNKPFETPSNCPCCDSKLIIEDIRLFCVNAECEAQKLEYITSFLKELEIKDISSKRIEKMLKMGLIKDIVDLYSLEISDFLTIDGIKEKSAEKFKKHLQESMKCDLIPFIKALSLNGGSRKASELLGDEGFVSLDQFLKLKESDVEFLGEIRGPRFLSELNKKKELIGKLLDLGFKINDIESKGSALKDKTFCITGKLSRPRKELEELIKNNGGSISSSVSSKTTYLVVNTTSNSSKYLKAKENNVSIINEEKLNQLIK